MPPIPVTLVLLVAGGLAGSLANWAIVSLGYWRRRPASPWSTPDVTAPPRQWWDRIPVLGWFGMRREVPLHGRGFWIRPLLIELVFAVGAVWFWQWQHRGGLVGGRVVPLPPEAELWFAAHCLLFVLLTIATFIDFDEQTIPDWITVPGTLAGLGFAVAAPGFHLPELVSSAVGVLSVKPVDYASPYDTGLLRWPTSGLGLGAGLATIVLWCAALMPKITTLRWGWWRGLRLMVASVVRPQRRKPCAIRLEQRKPFAITWLLAGLALVLCAITIGVYAATGPRWTSLLSSLLGMAMGGGLVWAVRLIAGQALGQEAMGFGDVTLMAMIGTFVGWQAALLVFALAPIAAVIIAVFQFALTKNREIAFGPYLALAAVAVIIGWHAVWIDWARNGIFFMPGLLLAVIGGSLVAMGVMLFGLRWIRGG
jgi:prepilin signal peptidase PulO-like enzyme (type II secretory pathway)